MKLEEYTKAGNKDTFTYWIESKLDKIGSIWGGSAFKFGIFSRDNTDEKKSNNKRSYDSEYGWYTKDGTTREEAFKSTKDKIIKLIKERKIKAAVIDPYMQNSNADIADLIRKKYHLYKKITEYEIYTREIVDQKRQ